MRISVLIPTYNSSKTIRATLNSVLHQTAPPHEILVLDDGSTDNTVSLLNSYKPTIAVFERKNGGVANARNALIKRAEGDLIAFLDHDDLWHPSYLDSQRGLFEHYPNAVAFFTGHINFYGFNDYGWRDSPPDARPNIELIDPLSFLQRYNKTTGSFASMSYCCIPKRVLTGIGDEPFCVRASGADDFYLFNLLPLIGPAVYCSASLVAYRITEAAQSANRLTGVESSVRALEILAVRYREATDRILSRAFWIAFASRRRHYAKFLMGAGKCSEARTQLLHSLNDSHSPRSQLKSLALLLFSYLPDLLQPKWPSAHR